MQTKRNTAKSSTVTNVVFDSFIGTTHRRNEDKVFVLPSKDYTILGVFDGVGSAKNNSLATKLASQFIKKRHSRFYREGLFMLEEMVLNLNKEILEHPEAESAALSTCAICVYFEHTNILVFLTLGDTRIYALGKHYVTKLTEDDVVFPGSNMVTRCLGIDLDEQEISQVVISNFKDDILICSDGFYKIFEETRVRFFNAFLKKRNATIKNNLQDLVANKNTDDASYVLFKNV
jgi:serine/threonine protein phosphatase PrpC